jgi:nucleotide-binding universal stress UspA family protein
MGRGASRDQWRLDLKRLSRVICAVAIDDRDRHVFAHALAVARRNNAQLLVLHAASPEVAFNRGAAERVDFLGKLRALAEGAGVDALVTVQRGPVAEIILLHARARSADLIVLGTRRNEKRRGLSAWIAEQVLRDAPCPTLVVPQASDPPALAERVLCAVDFSPASHAAVHAAVQLSEYSNQPVTLLHVVDGRGSNDHVHAAGFVTDEFHRGLGADAMVKLQSMIPQWHVATAETRVVVGRPATEILRAVRSMKAQLIVIGAARRTRIGSKLFGKTGHLLRDAHCPILAVPVPDVARTGTAETREWRRDAELADDTRQGLWDSRSQKMPKRPLVMCRLTRREMKRRRWSTPWRSRSGKGRMFICSTSCAHAG